MKKVAIVWCVPTILTPNQPEIVISRRATLNEDLFPGDYEIVTGHVRASETTKRSARRELKEEIGARREDVLYLIRLGETSQQLEDKIAAGDVFIAILRNGFDPMPEKGHEKPVKYPFENTRAFLEKFKNDHTIPIKWPDVNVMQQYADAIDETVKRTAGLLSLARGESREKARVPSKSTG